MPNTMLYRSHLMPDHTDALLAMPRFFAACARGLVEAQEQLDEQGCDSMIAWDEEGIPPAVFMWSKCRLRFPVAFGCRRKAHAADRTQITIATRNESQGNLTLSIRYLPTPQGQEES